MCFLESESYSYPTKFKKYNESITFFPSLYGLRWKRRRNVVQGLSFSSTFFIFLHEPIFFPLFHLTKADIIEHSALASQTLLNLNKITVASGENIQLIIQVDSLFSFENL